MDGKCSQKDLDRRLTAMACCPARNYTTLDYNGNLTSKTDGTGTTNYTWDFENLSFAKTLALWSAIILYVPIHPHFMPSSGESCPRCAILLLMPNLNSLSKAVNHF